MEFENLQKNVFSQLSASLEQLSVEEYSRPCKILFNASIGQHVRHIIELYICLFSGYNTGEVNYDERKRDMRIETDKDLANELIFMIATHLGKPDKELVLHTPCHETTAGTFAVKTNYYRELIYNHEHTVHHMALIRIGINEASTITLPESFGVAVSTIKYRRSCAQ